MPGALSAAGPAPFIQAGADLAMYGDVAHQYLLCMTSVGCSHLQGQVLPGWMSTSGMCVGARRVLA